jgi:hypothetical protein
LLSGGGEGAHVATLRGFPQGCLGRGHGRRCVAAAYQEYGEKCGPDL